MCNYKLSRVDYERPAVTTSDAVPLKVVNILTDTRTIGVVLLLSNEPVISQDPIHALNECLR
jgi:hypothetical protein